MPFFKKELKGIAGKGLGLEARRNPTLGATLMTAILGSLASLPGELTYFSGYRITYVRGGIAHIRAHEIRSLTGEYTTKRAFTRQV